MSEAPDKKERAPRNWVSESLLLALVPVVAYSVALKYEHGVCGYFGVPTEVVQLSSWTVIGFTLGVLTSLMFLVLFVNGIATVLLNTPWLHRLASLHPALRFRLAFLLLSAFIASWLRLWYVLVLVLIVVTFSLLFDFCIPMVRRRGRPVLQAINEHEETEVQSLTRPIELLPRRIVWVAFFLLVAWMGLLAAEYAGRCDAARTTRFRCLTIDSDTWVILRIYGDSAYCGALSAGSNQLNGRYRAVALTGLVWEERTLGPVVH